MFAAFQFSRVALIHQSLDFLNQLPLAGPPPLVWLTTALIQGIASLLIGLGLWQGRQWAGRLAPLYAILAMAAFWVNRLWFATDPQSAVNWAFNLALHVLMAGTIFWITLRPRAQSFFGVSND